MNIKFMTYLNYLLKVQWFFLMFGKNFRKKQSLESTWKNNVLMSEYIYDILRLILVSENLFICIKIK